MKPLQDIIGQKHNRLLIEQTMGFDENHHTLCLCRCDCGGQTIQKASEVISGHVKQCENCQKTHRKPDLSERVFGWLVAKKYAGKDTRNNRTYECLCFNPKPEPECGPCGRTKNVAATALVHGLIQSCGCLLQEKRNENIKRAQEASKTHGLWGTGVYNSWDAMVKRCYDPDHMAYPKYGGVGVFVCEFLKKSPANVVTMIGQRPEGKTIDRIEGKGNYTCGQCSECITNKWPMNIRWLTHKEQAVNRKSTVWLMIDGVLKTRMQAATELGIPYKKAVYLLKKFEVNMKPVEFKAPDGVVPEGTKAGEEFDLVSTFRVKANGNICLVMLGDTKMPGYSDKDEPKGKASYADEHAAMTASGAGNGNGDAGGGGDTQGAY